MSFLNQWESGEERQLRKIAEHTRSIDRQLQQRRTDERRAALDALAARANQYDEYYSGPTMPRDHRRPADIAKNAGRVRRRVAWTTLFGVIAVLSIIEVIDYWTLMRADEADLAVAGVVILFGNIAFFSSAAAIAGFGFLVGSVRDVLDPWCSCFGCAPE